MVLITPQFLMYDNVRWYRRLVNGLSSEQWTLAGFLCLVLSGYAGFIGAPWLCAGFLLLHPFCDTNDGLVYRHVENGRWNGYGLYMDHLCDAVGAAAVALGGHFLLGNAWLVVGGLVLFYLIAVHSWLYKIVRVSLGERDGADFWVVIEPGSRYWRIGPDDLVLVLAAIVVTRSILLLAVLDALLAVVFVVKAGRAMRLLRATCWRPLDADATPSSISRTPASRSTLR